MTSSTTSREIADEDYVIVLWPPSGEQYVGQVINSGENGLVLGAIAGPLYHEDADDMDADDCDQFLSDHNAYSDLDAGAHNEACEQQGTTWRDCIKRVVPPL